MNSLLQQLYLPVGTAYQRNCTIRRTVAPRPRAATRPMLSLMDLQAMPPPGWCPGCGMELYRPGQKMCPECAGEEGG
ncbi:MAG: hypothetical protein J6A74_01325 [Oscillospiraceae bacterium]|nr:hypothetical protein [Oscillospiraceae bacterium]